MSLVDVETGEVVTIQTPAYPFACAWGAVANSWSDDGDRFALYRTVLIERHEHYTVLAATDSYTLFLAAVRDAGHVEHIGLDRILAAEPIATVSVCDDEKRVSSLMAHVRRSLKKEDSEPWDLSIETGTVLDEGSELSMFPRHGVRFTIPDERVVALENEADFPNWRRLFDQVKPGQTDVVALSTETVGKIAKLPDGIVQWTFGSRLGPAVLAATPLDIRVPLVWGIAMPVRIEGGES